jgi:hypothetical protein
MARGASVPAVTIGAHDGLRHGADVPPGAFAERMCRRRIAESPPDEPSACRGRADGFLTTS